MTIFLLFRVNCNLLNESYLKQLSLSCQKHCFLQCMRCVQVLRLRIKLCLVIAFRLEAFWLSITVKWCCLFVKVLFFKWNLVPNSVVREYALINWSMSLIDNNRKSLLREPTSLKVVQHWTEGSWSLLIRLEQLLSARLPRVHLQTIKDKIEIKGYLKVHWINSLQERF